MFGFDVKFGCVVDECRPAKGCIKKWVHGSANGQLELSTTEEVNGKNMEKSTMEMLTFTGIILNDPSLESRIRDSLKVIYALSDFLIMILSWLVKQSLRAFLFQEVQP